MAYTLLLPSHSLACLFLPPIFTDADCMWQDYLEKSEHNLQAAGRDFEHRGYDPCASRAYFSVFHAALAALLALSDFQRRGKYWDHENIAAEFARRLIHRRKVFSRTLADTLDNLRSLRHRADYTRRPISRSQAGQSLGKARKFVEQIKASLQEERMS